MRRLIVSLALALVLVFSFALPAFALTTADVTVTATPEYLAITNTGGNWTIGIVAENTTKWGTATGAAPTEAGFLDTEMKWTATNTGSIDSDIGVHTHNFTGTVGWTLSGTVVGLNTVVLAFGKTGTVGKAACLKLVDTTSQELSHQLAAGGHIDWCMYLDTGTFDEGSAKSATVTLTISKHTT